MCNIKNTNEVLEKCNHFDVDDVMDALSINKEEWYEDWFIAANIPSVIELITTQPLIDGKFWKIYNQKDISYEVADKIDDLGFLILDDINRSDFPF